MAGPLISVVSFCGVQVLSSLGRTGTPRDLERKHFVKSMFLLGCVLVDLVGFEPTTSSMPFKKYQSLAGILTRNKRLSTRGIGRRWTPLGVIFGFGLQPDSGTPRRAWLSAGPRRAAVGAGAIQQRSVSPFIRQL